MRRGVRFAAAGSVTAGLLLSMAPTAQALTPVPLPGTTQVLAAWSSYAVPTEDDARSAMDEFLCPTTRRLPKASKTEAAAIARAGRALSSIERPKTLTALNAALAPLTLPVLQETLYALGMGGRLGGAIATSLRMAQLSPERRHLVNAAALLLHYNKDAEAADLLAWAAKRTQPTDTDGSAQAAFDNARGELQLSYGRFAAAERFFQAAATENPLATAPRVGIAQSLQCRGKSDDAARWWARGQRAIDLPTSFDEAGNSQAARVGPNPRWKIILVEPLIDPNVGIGGAKFAPWQPPENANISDTYAMDAIQFALKTLDESNRYIPDSVRMTWVQRQIHNYAIRLEETDRSLGILDGMMDNQWRVVAEAADNGPNDDGCGAADNYGAFWSGVRRMYELHQDMADRRHQIWTAAATQTASPAVNRYFNQIADEAVFQEYYEFTSELAAIGDYPGWGGIADAASEAAFRVQMNDQAREMGAPLFYPGCQSSFNGFKTGPFEGPDDPTIPGGLNACNKATKGFFIKIGTPDSLKKKLPVSAELKTTCDSASIELKGPPVGLPLATLSLFGTGEYNYEEGSVEIFAGVKGEYGFEEAGMESNVGVSVKYGMGDDGPEIIDVSLKSEAAVKLGDEHKGYEVKRSESISFMPAKR